MNKPVALIVTTFLVASLAFGLASAGDITGTSAAQNVQSEVHTENLTWSTTEDWQNGTLEDVLVRDGRLLVAELMVSRDNSMTVNRSGSSEISPGAAMVEGQDGNFYVAHGFHGGLWKFTPDQWDTGGPGEEVFDPEYQFQDIAQDDEGYWYVLSQDEELYKYDDSWELVIDESLDLVETDGVGYHDGSLYVMNSSYPLSVHEFSPDDLGATGWEKEIDDSDAISGTISRHDGFWYVAEDDSQPTSGIVMRYDDDWEPEVGWIPDDGFWSVLFTDDGAIWLGGDDVVHEYDLTTTGSHTTEWREIPDDYIVNSISIEAEGIDGNDEIRIQDSEIAFEPDYEQPIAPPGAGIHDLSTLGDAANVRIHSQFDIKDSIAEVEEYRIELVKAETYYDSDDPVTITFHEGLSNEPVTYSRSINGSDEPIGQNVSFGPIGGEAEVTITKANFSTTETNSTVLAYDAAMNSGELVLAMTDLEPFHEYQIVKDGEPIEEVISDQDGDLTYRYEGEWSEHSFEVIVVGEVSGFGPFPEEGPTDFVQDHWPDLAVISLVGLTLGVGYWRWRRT